MSIIDRTSISQDFRKIGIEAGDALFIQSNMKTFAQVKGNPVEQFLTALFDVLGDDGTLVVPAYTLNFVPVWKTSKLFTADSRTYTGALANYLIRKGEASRSLHPTHSMMAIGRHANYFVEGHDHYAKPFSMFDKLAEVGGKQMLLGCVGDTPGMPSVHAAQDKLGLSKRHWNRLIHKVKYVDENNVVREHALRESPGCSKGFDKMYGRYILDENLSTGYIGSAWTVVNMIDTALAADLEVLSKNPRFVLCDRVTCVSCRALRGYNKRSLPVAIPRILAKKIGSLRR